MKPFRVVKGEMVWWRCENERVDAKRNSSTSISVRSIVYNGDYCLSRRIHNDSLNSPTTQTRSEPIFTM